ncbi:MAG TPA: dephospho-CoA kinase, partial [Myxococcota bacterium]|nr:dephospho-CoA kinase [Myxococcota bacterium]
MHEFKRNTWGLTGGIGAGKSMAADILRGLGVPVIDMDRTAARLMTPGTSVYTAVVDRFGTRILRPDQTIDRSVLAGLVFSDKDRLKELEAIVHPATIAETARRVDCLPLSGLPFVFVESAIVFEAGIDAMLGGVVLVTAPESIRMDRVMRRDGMSKDQFLARVA